MRMQRPMDYDYDNAQTAADSPDNQLSAAQRQWVLISLSRH